VKASAGTCTGGTPAPTRGTVSVLKTITTTNANRCSKILPNTLFTTKTDAIPFTMNDLWMPTGITPTSVAFPNLKVTSTTGGSALTFHSVGTATLSYPDATASISIKTLQSYTTIWSAALHDCGGADGLSAVNIRAAGTTGTF
jgi:hypothetical protein